MAAITRPFLLSRRRSQQPPPHALPFPLYRRIGTVGEVSNRRKMLGALAWLNANSSPVQPVGMCENWTTKGQAGVNAINVSYQRTLTQAICRALRVNPYYLLANCADTQISATLNLSNCQRTRTRGNVQLTSCTTSVISSTVAYQSCTSIKSSVLKTLHHCDSFTTSRTVLYATCVASQSYRRSLTACTRSVIQRTVASPCRFYPIPDMPEPPPQRKCRLRPPSSQLHFKLTRRRVNQPPASQLPFYLQCWHAKITAHIPERTFIVKNTITASIGGIAVNLIDFDISTDMNSYCWQGSVAIPPSSFEKIKAKLDVARGQEPLVSVVVNGFTFTFLAQEQQRSREFAKHAHTITGNSISVRLGADYALARGGQLTESNMASQLISQQLDGLGIAFDFEIDDWLIPANQYAIGEQSPLAVIDDVASAAGAFVFSHPSEARIAIKPRWQVAAWDLSTADPDVVFPVGVNRRITDQKRVAPRYNTVRLDSGGMIDGGHVFRQEQGQSLSAGTQTHALYTVKEAIIPAGTAILSESGIHADYVLTTRWTDKYNIPLAELGQIWQINDTEGSWRGVVKKVAIAVNIENDAPTVWQTITIDRYLDV